MRARLNHADRIALLIKATPISPLPSSPTWVDFWAMATYANFQYFGAAVAQLVETVQ